MKSDEIITISIDGLLHLIGRLRENAELAAEIKAAANAGRDKAAATRTFDSTEIPAELSEKCRNLLS